MYKKNILALHLNTQVVKSFFAILVILIGLICSSRLVGYFEQAAAGSLNPDIIFSIIALRIPDFLSLLVPFAFFLSLLLVVSNLYSSSEIYAIFSAGMSRLNLITLLSPFFFLVLSFSIVLSIFIAPYATVLSKQLIENQSYQDRLELLEPDSLIDLDGKGSNLHFLSQNANSMQDVTFFVEKDTSMALIKSKELEVVSEGGQMLLNFSNGFIYPNINDDSNLSISFVELTHSIDGGEDGAESFNLKKLLDFQETSSFINQQWSFSIPLMLFSLMVMGFAFGKSNPRSGKEGSLVLGILIYILYLSALVALRESFANSYHFMFYALWPIHALFFAFSAAVYFHDGKGLFRSHKAGTRYKISFILFIIFGLMMWLSS